MAVLPTPGSPTSSGLFFWRRHRTWIVRCTSDLAADQRVDLAVLRLLVQVDAITVERVAFFLRASFGLIRCGTLAALLLGTARRAAFGERPGAWRCRG